VQELKKWVKGRVIDVIVTQHFRLSRMKMPISGVYLSGYRFLGIRGALSEILIGKTE